MPDLEPLSFGNKCMQAIAEAKRVKQSAGQVFTMRDVAEIIDRFDRERFRANSPDQIALTPAERVYAVYPRHVGKKSALRVITAVLGTMDLADLLAKVQAYADAVKKWPPSEQRFIPYPATWFNRGSYADDPKEWTRGRPDDRGQTDYAKI